MTMSIFSRKKDRLRTLCEDCTAYYIYALDATTLSDYLERWDRFASEAETLSKDPDLPSLSGFDEINYKKVMELYESAIKQQANMRRIIERQRVISGKAMLGRLKDNVSAKVNLYLDVAREFNDNKERFSEETLDFAQRALDKLYLMAGKENISRQILIPEWAEASVPAGGRRTIETVDLMNGSAFEVFCGELLQSNGFTDVDLIAKSGDQGVDIVAEKDSVRYAFQCKRYDSDLGNSPIQEVYAGKEMYGCHVGVVMTNRHFTNGAKALAEKTHVLLWDRETLIKMMEKM